MASCPYCRFANAKKVELCGRCGARLIAPKTVKLTTPLPAPMVEPIHTPPKPEVPTNVDRPGPSVLFREEAFSDIEDSTPFPSGDAQVPVVESPTVESDERRKRGSLGTLPAHPGLPGHPMNDSSLNPAVTVPATAPADQGPQPVEPPPLKPKLVVLRGVKINAEYPIYEGRNTIGRFADKPVDIDLMTQESVEQIWCSRQHAVIIFEKGIIAIEDLNSLNGTWVNGARIHPKQPRQLRPGDVVQIGTVQMKLVVL